MYVLDFMEKYYKKFIFEEKINTIDITLELIND